MILTFDFGFQGSMMNAELEEAVFEAHSALRMDINDRRKKYSFASR